MGAGDPSAADRRQAEVAPGGRLRRPCCPQAHRVRDDPLRDDDGRYSMPTISTPTRYGGRCYSTESQERRPRRHSRVHSLSASSSQGIDQLTIWSGHFFLLILSRSKCQKDYVALVRYAETAYCALLLFFRYRSIRPGFLLFLFYLLFKEVDFIVHLKRNGFFFTLSVPSHQKCWLSRDGKEK